MSSGKLRPRENTVAEECHVEAKTITGDTIGRSEFCFLRPSRALPNKDIDCARLRAQMLWGTDHCAAIRKRNRAAKVIVFCGIGGHKLRLLFPCDAIEGKNVNRPSGIIIVRVSNERQIS